jgi:hypothetical protein
MDFTKAEVLSQDKNTITFQETVVLNKEDLINERDSLLGEIGILEQQKADLSKRVDELNILLGGK